MRRLPGPAPCLLGVWVLWASASAALPGNVQRKSSLIRCHRGGSEQGLPKRAGAEEPGRARPHSSLLRRREGAVQERGVLGLNAKRGGAQKAGTGLFTDSPLAGSSDGRRMVSEMDGSLSRVDRRGKDGHRSSVPRHGPELEMQANMRGKQALRAQRPPLQGPQGSLLEHGASSARPTRIFKQHWRRQQDATPTHKRALHSMGHPHGVNPQPQGSMQEGPLPIHRGGGRSGAAASRRGGGRKKWVPGFNEAVRRPWLRSGVGTRSQVPGQNPSDVCAQVVELSVDGIQKMYFNRTLTAVQLVSCYLQRIRDFSNPKTFNKNLVPYAVNAVIELNPNALKDAAAKDVQRTLKCGRALVPACLGPMHGIPVLLKDNIASDGTNNTAGSFALLGCQHASSYVDQRLRASGAIILGKAGMTEWASYREWSNLRVEGWSARNGQVLNPYVRFRAASVFTVYNSPYLRIPSAVKSGKYRNQLIPDMASGSSSGSGAAAAMSLATVAVGTETTGSIVYPSDAQGLVGIRPTVGLISRRGVIPFSSRQDTPGPMARTVADAVYALDAMHGLDPQDPATEAQRWKVPKRGYRRFLKTGGLAGRRMAAVNYRLVDIPGDDTNVFDAYFEAINKMRGLGAEIDLIDLDETGVPWNEGPVNNGLLFATEFKNDVAAYLAGCTWKQNVSPLRTLKDLMNFNKINYKLEFQGGACCRGNPAYANHFQRLWENAQSIALDYSDQRYAVALGDVQQNIASIDDFFVSNGYSIFLHIVNFGVLDYVSKFAQARLPSIVVPLTTDSIGLPAGLVLSGRAWSEGTLIQVAYDIEQRINMQQRPLPTFCDTSC